MRKTACVLWLGLLLASSAAAQDAMPLAKAALDRLIPAMREHGAESFMRGVDSQLGQGALADCAPALDSMRESIRHNLVPIAMDSMFTPPARDRFEQAMVEVYTVEQLRDVANGGNPATTDEQRKRLAAKFEEINEAFLQQMSGDPRFRDALSSALADALPLIAKCGSATSPRATP